MSPTTAISLTRDAEVKPRVLHLQRYDWLPRLVARLTHASRGPDGAQGHRFQFLHLLLTQLPEQQ